MAAKKRNVGPAFQVDTYRVPESGKYVAAAVKFLGKRRVGALHWKEREFDTNYEADRFVRDHFAALGIQEMADTSMAYYR